MIHVLQIILVILKVIGVINASWIWVFMPYILYALFNILVLVAVGVIAWFSSK